MALDSRYIIASDLQVLFRDKDTGAPLSAGVITFYEDEARTVLKPVYKLSGSPPNYSYVAIQNPVTLSAIGTFQDPQTGDDIVPYYFPYDANGNIELYYITVYSSGGVLQFTREAWPNLVLNSGSNQLVANYAPNGQFLIHANVVPDTTSTPAGKITQPVTVLSQGGWTFERPAGSTATDIVTFEATGSPVTNPDASPKYHLRIVNQVPNATDTFKDVRLTFDDVNKFASTTQNYTYGFTAQSNSSSPISASIVLIKNFGTGGSPSATTETTLENITIPASYGVVQTDANLGFVFGTNIGKVIGTNNDDKVQLALRLPTSAAFDVSVVDFVLTPGAVTLKNFPPTPNRQFSYQSITAPTPAADNSDLYLPLRLTPTGLEYDHTEVGKIYSAIYATAGVGELLCDGTQYETAAYSSEGIPYSRLQAKLFNSTYNYPIFGTGAHYITAHLVDSPQNIMYIMVNSAGAVTATSDGTPATGFTFSTLATGQSAIATGLFLSGGNFYIRANSAGLSSGTNGAGTSGFGLEMIENGTLLRSVWEVMTTAATGLASKYFQFSILATQYYVWFKVDGTGTDPAPGGTGILVNLNSAFSADDVAHAICSTISGMQVSLITFNAASTVAAGSYFNVYSTTDHFYVWYTKDGAGTDPKPAGAKPIQVDILSADTNLQVAAKTLLAINKKYFAVPDLRGMFLRGWNNGAGVDPTSNIRWSNNPFVFADAIGSYQLDTNQQHNHPGSTVTVNSGNSLLKSVASTSDANAADGVDIHMQVVAATATPNIAYDGFEESHPVNVYVNYIIKY